MTIVLQRENCRQSDASFFRCDCHYLPISPLTCETIVFNSFPFDKQQIANTNKDGI